MITPRTTGIIGVHLWGRAGPVAELQEIADEHGLKLLFDAAHAFGCSLGARMIGGFGEAEVFSFHATKFYNTFEGGAVTTNNDELAEAMRFMRNFGFSSFDNVILPGTNAKLTEICAAMGLVNLDGIDDVIAANRRNYQAYSAAFAGLHSLSLVAYDEAERNNFQYVILEVAPNCGATRDEIVAALHMQNVLARKYFWPGCHRMKPFRELFPHAGLVLPNTETVANRVLVLPTGTALPQGAVETIAQICCAAGAK
jgi:dTDP-4-amino-4,6-dideoxygalactose transaminase